MVQPSLGLNKLTQQVVELRLGNGKLDDFVLLCELLEVLDPALDASWEIEEVVCLDYLLTEVQKV